jgi:DNA-binding transcriptional regulator YhcF (GntR family)
MLITVNLSNPKPAYLQITDAVRTAIARGSLQPGDRLPAIRETAVQTRVNRNTVSRAYLELEHQGLVRARQGSGFYVTDGGDERERSIRQDALNAQVRELVIDARLSRTSTKRLLQMVRECAETLGGPEPNGPRRGGRHD